MFRTTTPEFNRSLRLLDDGQLDRLAEAVAEEARRRRRGLPGGPSASGADGENAGFGKGETGGGERRIGDAGTGASDPRRPGGWPEAGGGRAGVPPRAGDRAAGHCRRPARPSVRLLAAVGGEIKRRDSGGKPRFSEGRFFPYCAAAGAPAAGWQEGAFGAERIAGGSAASLSRPAAAFVGSGPSGRCVT